MKHLTQAKERKCKKWMPIKPFTNGKGKSHYKMLNIYQQQIQIKNLKYPLIFQYIIITVMTGVYISKAILLLTLISPFHSDK